MRWFAGLVAGVVLVTGLGAGGMAVAAENWNGTAVLRDAPAGDAKPQTYDGTVTWTTGTDASGAQTMVGTAQFASQSLGVELTIGANPDASIPASHLVDLRFQPGAGFAGKSIADVSALALKNEEAMAGVKLAGAIVKVAENAFLMALSNGKEDLSRNMALLGDRDFLDIGIVDGTGKRFVVTLGLGGARAAFAAFAAAGLK